MIKKLLTSAVFAGVAVGVVSTVLHLWLITPLLLEGELYETGAKVHFAANGSSQSDAGGVSIWTEPARHLTTLGFNMVTFTAFGLLLVAGFALSERRGHHLSPQNGLIWGLCAFVAVQLAPAIGLPPELPGTIAAEVALRQAWWITTILCTGAGLAMIAFARALWPMALGTILMVLPHIWGAPHLDTYFGVAPPELSAHFATSSLGASAISWSLLGLFAAMLWTRCQEA